MGLSRQTRRRYQKSQVPFPRMIATSVFSSGDFGFFEYGVQLLFQLQLRDIRIIYLNRLRLWRFARVHPWLCRRELIPNRV
ncbi:hypothetical protein AFLA_002218 [Aspergillus flavus NRRL3357]|nr:hypothetical protein AFLA_002218 [Aspergillus flavus NRRL3357]